MRTADSGIKAFFNPEVTKLSKETRNDERRLLLLTFPIYIL